MASKENKPNSPRTPKSKRGSLQGLFEGLSIEQTISPPSSSKMQSLASCLKGTFSKGWPPSLRLSNVDLSTWQGMPFTIGMSQDYRFYDDKWRVDKNVKDETHDVSVTFAAAEGMMKDISDMLKGPVSETDMKAVMLEEMAAAVFASNQRAKVGLDLDETLKICLQVFKGEVYQYSERSQDYQARIDAFVSKDSEGKASQVKSVVRSRREVVQHAAALQHLVTQYVRANKPLTEDLIKEAHKILTEGLGGDDAGVFGTKSFAGTYRRGDEHAYAAAHRFTRPADIPMAMKSMVDNLKTDLEIAEQNNSLDPFALAAKYCDRMVNIHPFKDGNGRTCRMILNVVLLKYAGIVISLGEKGESRQEYLEVAIESRQVGGHHGQLATMVLEQAVGTLKNLKASLRQKVRRSLPGATPTKNA